MARPSAHDHASVRRTTLFVRWLVLLMMAFDLLSAPLHAHAHDMGPDLSTLQMHLAAQTQAHAAQDAPAAPALAGDDGDHDPGPQVSSAHHERMGHSMAALRTAQGDTTVTPDLAAVVDRVAEIIALPRLQVALIEQPWTPGTDPVPIAGLCAWRPEGRAPPVLHS